MNMSKKDNITVSHLSNEELVILYNYGEEWVLNEVYSRFERMIHYFINKHRYTDYLEDDEIKSACHIGLTKAIKSYNSSKKCSFSFMVHRHMQREVSHAYDYLKRFDRDKLHSRSVSMNLEIDNKDGESTQLIEILDSGLQNDTYFKDEYIVTKKALDYSLEESNENIREHILDLIYENISVSELANKLNMTRQNVQYHVNRFKKLFKKYIEIHNIDYT